jgi:hypothetical protein
MMTINMEAIPLHKQEHNDTKVIIGTRRLSTLSLLETTELIYEDMYEEDKEGSLLYVILDTLLDFIHRICCLK